MQTCVCWAFQSAPGRFGVAYKYTTMSDEAAAEFQPPCGGWIVYKTPL